MPRTQMSIAPERGETMLGLPCSPPPSGDHADQPLPGTQVLNQSW